jgi:subtilisin-like proprotein convertase family protein/subtilisin family serine protease
MVYHNPEPQKSSSNRTKHSSRKKLQAPYYEALEPKNLLAADLFNLTAGSPKINPLEFVNATGTSNKAVQATHHYYAGGQSEGMVVFEDRIAISRTPSVLTKEHAKVLQAYALEETRTLANSTFSVFSTGKPVSENLLRAITESGWGEATVPVFKVVSSQSEAVLLNEVIVKLPTDVNAAEYFADQRFQSFHRLAGTPDQFVATLSAGYGEVALSEINAMSKDSRVDWAIPNFHQAWQRFFIPNDPRWANMWTLHHTGQQASGPNAVPGLADTDVNMPEAWDIKQGSNASIIIGVLDDGVPFNHPDLLVYQGDANASTDSNGNGWVGDLHGWDFVNNNNNSHPIATTDTHGTAVAGIAAARGNNGVGVVGAAFGSPILSARMFAGSSVATDAQIASAMYYLSGRTFDGQGQWNAASVVNHSWGGGAVSVAINTAMQWATTEARGGKGVTQFFASGNSGGLIGNPANQAAVNAGIVTVGAINNAGELTPYHNRGPLLDIVTPSNDFRTGPGGEQIYLRVDTTDRVGADGYNSSLVDGDYTGTGATGFGGTSAAAPLAAGVAALALARAEDLGIDITAAELRKLLRNNTRLVDLEIYDTANNGQGFNGGYGLLNAETLLRGIGNAQLSVTTSLIEVVNESTGWSFGSQFTKSITDAVLRVRNQGTEDLNYTITVNGSSAYSISSNAQASLGRGDASNFSIRFNPLTAGTHTAEIVITSNDPNNPVFSFEIESEAVAAQINGFLFEDFNGDGTQQSFETPIGGVPVLFDTNGNGVIDTFSVNSFSTAPNLSFSDAVPAISTLNVSGLSDFVTDINVKLNVTHAWVSDMVIFLEAPNGDFSLLFNQWGGSGDNLVDTVFDDQAPNPIGSGIAPFTGSWRPDTPLSVFNGMKGSEANGVWTLYIFDVFAADDGVLLNWELQISSGEASAVTNELGFYAFTDLDPGNYTAVPLLPSQWSASPGSNASYPITITGSNDEYDCSDFGVGFQNRFYANVFNDINGNGIVDAGEAGRSDRSLFLDGNQNGIIDGSVSNNFSANPNLVVPDNSTVTTTLSVSGLSGFLDDLNVTVNMTHTWMADVQIWLADPNGTEIQLFNRHGGSGDNLENTVFDDQAAASISTGSAPFTGSWQPIQPLATFNGINPNGVWTLRIRDNATGDVGTLSNWNLEIATNPDFVFTTNADGWALLDLPSGNHDLLLTNVGWTFTVPVDGKLSVTASGAPLFNQTYGERDAVTLVSGSFVYYGGSTFSGWNRLDTIKSLAKEGSQPQTLGFNNLTNSTRGINGIVFDIDNLPGNLTASDFVFQMSPLGNFNEAANPPANWISAPNPSSISVTPGSTDRVLIAWPNNAIQNRWLRITIKANANTGLLQDEVYYIGHLRGEVTGLSGSSYSVTVADAVAISNVVSPVPVNASNLFDINKSGNVTVADIVEMTGNIGTLFLRNITIPGSGSRPGLMFGGGDNFDGGRDGKENGRTGSGADGWIFGEPEGGKAESGSSSDSDRKTRLSNTPVVDLFFEEVTSAEDSFIVTLEAWNDDSLQLKKPASLDSKAQPARLDSLDAGKTVEKDDLIAKI